MGAPLRPCAEDIAIVAEAVRCLEHPEGAPRRVLLLGVTPELHDLGWPQGTDFVAADRNAGMIDAVWPGPREAVRCCEWLDLDLPDSSRDIALCDGGLHLVRFPDDQQRLAGILHRILRRGGIFVVRLFAPPPVRENASGVLDDFAAGRVANLNILKLRLGMSMMPSAAEGIELGLVWNAVNAVAHERGSFAERIGWNPDHLAAIDAYRASTARYHFATLEEVAALFGACGFRVAGVRVPSYELGDRCPTVVFERL